MLRLPREGHLEQTVSLLQPADFQAKTSCGEAYAKKQTREREKRGQPEHDTIGDGGTPVSDSKRREEGEGTGQSLLF